MLTDPQFSHPELKTIKQYGSAMEHNGTKIAARNTFLINPEGKIARVYRGVNPAVHSEEVLKDLAVLKKSQCASGSSARRD
jgi:peroxiredoxin Q/BCP